MAKQTLYFNSYYDAFSTIVEKIQERQVDLDKKHILLVPEKHTLHCEQLLFKGGGAFDVEVYSLSRWFLKLGGGKLLTKSGAIMILKDILYEKQLKCFYRSKNFVGFAARLYQTICQFSDSKLDAGSITASGALGLKLKDIDQISKEFATRAQGLSVDKAGKVAIILDNLKSSDFLSSANIYTLGFDKLTKTERELFDYLSKDALSFTNARVSGRKKIRAKTQVYAANGIISCLKSAAARIRELSYSGESFSDMAIVAPELGFEQAKRIIQEAGIPFYVDNSQQLSHTKLFEYLECLFNLRRLSRQDFIVLSKNPFANVDYDNADIFENYCLSFMIDYKGFTQPFSLTNPQKDQKQEKIRLKIAEKVRANLHRTAQDFWSKLKEVDSVTDFSSIVKQQLDKVSQDSSEKQRIFLLLDTMEQHLSSKQNSGRLKFLIEALIEGAAAESMSKLPRVQNCVLIGDAGIFKGAKYKHVFLVGFNEGKLPQPSASNGLMTEQEIKQLSGFGGELTLKSEDDKQKEYELLQLLSTATNIFISYDTSEDSRISPIFYTIAAETREVELTSTEKEVLAAAEGQTKDVLMLGGSKSAALENLILQKDSPSACTFALHKALGDKYEKYLSPPPSPKTIKTDIFFYNSTVSVSQLQTYFSCPYKHFIEYGLRAKKRDSGEADVLDIGNAIHKINQLYALSGFDESQLEDIAQSVFSQGKYTYEKNQRLKDKLMQEVLSVCIKFGRHLKNGRYKMINAELAFGKKEKYKGCQLGDIMLGGSIDYADAKDNYIRIIDYKTGFAEFSEKELFYGQKLQLPLYMLSMVKNGYIPAAMLYFMFREKWGEEDYRFNGVYLKDKQVLLDFDPNMKEENAVVPAKIKNYKSGEKITGKGGVSANEFLIYLNYAKEVATLAIEQIKQGNITPSPYKNSGFLICKYCEFAPACGFTGPPRVAQKAEIIYDEKEE